MQLYRTLPFGRLAQLNVLDTRQFRTDQPCRDGLQVPCPDVYRQDATMMGTEQERWLLKQLLLSRSRWNVIAQQTLMAQLDRKVGPGQQFWTDGWDGYPVARRRLLDYVGNRKPANPVVIGGDVHAFYVADLKPDFDDPKSPVVATEFVGTSVTSQFGRSQQAMDALRGENPHLRLANGAHRGYVRMDVTPKRLTAELRAMRSVTQPRAEVDTLATFVVEDGRLGAVRA
jgi:alkaline phosphatase D